MSILEFLYRAFETDVSFHVTVTIKRKTHELCAVAWIFGKRASHRRGPQLRFGAASGEDGSPTSPVDQSKCVDISDKYFESFRRRSERACFSCLICRRLRRRVLLEPPCLIT